MKYLFLFALFLISTQTFSQDPYITYFKNDGTIVKEKDSADYLQLIKDPEPGSKLYPVLELYMNGVNKTIGFSTSFYSPVYEGHVLTFFPNGKRKSSSTYLKGNIQDISTEYYPNGKLYKIADHKSNPIKFITVKDSLGNDMIVNGQGEIKIYNSDFTVIESQGKIFNGYRHGEWKGIMDSIPYVEEFKKGKLISGVSTDGNGKEYQYTSFQTESELLKKINEATRFIYKQLKSSANSRDIREMPNEQIEIRCILNKEGHMKEPKIGVVLSPKVRKIIFDAILQAPSFKPILVRGIPKQVTLVFPINVNDINY